MLKATKNTKVAVVTGANKGLGFALVKGLCEKFDGVVYLTSRDEKRGLEACDKLKNFGFKPLYHQLDITNEDSINRFCAHIKNHYNGIDVLINNAGILFLKDSTEDKLFQTEQTLLVNFFSLLNFTETVKTLIKDGGNIVNISSSSGHLSRIPSENLRNQLRSENLNTEKLKSLIDSYLKVATTNSEINEDQGWGNSPYVVSKVAVNAYTFILQKELASRGVLVNCVHPGYVISDMTRGSGNCSPEEAAVVPLKIALEVTEGGQYIWHDGTVVPWDGPDPRGYIDGIL